MCRPERSGITSVANDSAKSRCSGLIEEQKTEAVTRITDGHVPDQVYEEVRPHFTDKELADLALAVATINAWNRLAIASRSEPIPQISRGETAWKGVQSIRYGKNPADTVDI
ncbi:MAG: hypothetical protein DMG96_31485 [Acidobacteria bacterium]|nr:MAG: hypothetical protein DMG96_31485 [Acidobacteriota bacterium]